MIDFLIHTDTWLFRLLNGWHSPWADGLMWGISYKYTWIPMYLYLIYRIGKSYRKQAWILLLLTVLLVLCSDQFSVWCKDHFQRPRPCHNPLLEPFIHLVNNRCGGKYGFISSHAANSFAVAVFISLLFRERILIFILLSWAMVTAYSRVYLGVHYPGDVAAGAIAGTILGIIFYLTAMKILSLHNKNTTCSHDRPV